jgi:imidazolonepropionase-like amidohydrolase
MATRSPRTSAPVLLAGAQLFEVQHGPVAPREAKAVAHTLRLDPVERLAEQEGPERCPDLLPRLEPPREGDAVRSHPIGEGQAVRLDGGDDLGAERPVLLVALREPEARVRRGRGRRGGETRAARGREVERAIGQAAESRWPGGEGSSSRHPIQPAEPPPPDVGLDTGESPRLPTRSEDHVYTDLHVPTPPLVLRGALVCDGSAAPRPATLVIEGDRIAAVVPPEEPIVTEGQLVDLRGYLVTPGLIDVHTHVFLSADLLAEGAYELDLLKTSLPLRTLRGMANARAMLDEGFTTIRDVCTEGAGYADVALRDAIAAGVCEGPRLVPSGPGIGITGGYLPAGFPPGACRPSGCAVCDGPDAARREVRVQVAQGVSWIKVFADWRCSDAGGGISEVRPTFTRAELEAIVDEAARRGRRVAAHATSDAGAREAIACGVASIEHLGALSRATMDLAAERGVFVVPTLSAFEYMATHAPASRRDRARRTFDAAAEAFERLLASGVRVASGSDIGAFPHALGPLTELRALMELGMPPLRALRAATSDAAALLDLPGLGLLAPAATADLCAFRLAEDPTDLRSALAAAPPDLVIQAGRIVRDRERLA